MKKAIAIIVWILWASVLQAQVVGTTIYGQVKDAITGENLVNATLKLVNVKDSVILKQTINNKNGFKISQISGGKYFLQISYIGYRDTTYNVRIGGNDSIYNTGILVMTKGTYELTEIIVKATIPPVITKSDTVVYNADAFKTRPNATVEELLKKLPGVEVDNDGNITFQGKRIQKIYIDGKAFFFNDPKLATQNFLADMVQKVEAFDEKSERAKLTGIPDEETGKALNLQLKSDKKKGYFGNAEARYSSYNRYIIAASANHLKGDAFALIGAGSNNSGSNRNNNQSNNISLNYQNILVQNLLFKISFTGNKSNSHSWSYNQRQTFLEDSSLTQEKENTSAAENKNYNLNVGINYKPDSFSIFDIMSTTELKYGKNTTMDIAKSDIEKTGLVQPVNSALTNDNKNENMWGGNIYVNYNRSFRRRGRSIRLHLKYNRNQQSRNDILASLITFYNQSGITVDSLKRNSHSDENSGNFAFGLGVSYTEPVGNSQVLEFNYNLNRSNSENNRQTYNYNSVTGKFDIADSSASNSFENSQGEQSFGIDYNNFKSNKFRYQTGIGISKSRQQSINKTINHVGIEQTTSRIFPHASLHYSINKQRSIGLTYRGRNRPPSITEMQPLPDLSNPLLIRLGNPSLKPEFNNEISAEYANFNPKKMSNFVLQLNFRNTLNRIVNSIITNGQGIQEQQYINMNGDYGIGGSVSYSMPLVKQQKPLKIRYNTSASFYRDANLVNRELNKRNSATVAQGIQVNFHLREKLFISADGYLNFRLTKYSIQSTGKNIFISHQYSGNISYEFPGQFKVYTDFSISFNNTQQQPKTNNSVVWNASLIKNIFKDKKGELKLSIFDILNDKKDFNQTIGDNYIETNRTEAIKRIFALSFVYRFRKNK